MVRRSTVCNERVSYRLGRLEISPDLVSVCNPRPGNGELWKVGMSPMLEIYQKGTGGPAEKVMRFHFR